MAVVGEQQARPDVTMAAQSLNLYLRAQLVGRRLIGEVDLEEDLYLKITAAVQDVVHKKRASSEWLVRNCPALLAVYLGAEGMRRYSAGSFWPNLTVKGLDQQIVGPGFLSAIRRLELETFEQMIEEGALRYVGPILAHGGIPRYCLQDFFFGLLVPELRRSGSSEALDILSTWRSRKTVFENIDKPIKRFLLYGGAPAIDLLDRCIELVHASSVAGSVPTAADVGLPAYVVDEYKRGWTRDKASVAPRRAIQRPRVRFDPWDGLGPALDLPTIPDDIVEAVWRVETGQGVKEIPASHRETYTQRLAPTSSWEVELVHGLRVIRSFSFECLNETPLLCFDPASALLSRHPQELRLSSVWILAPRDTELIATMSSEQGDSELRTIEEFPDPVGAWDGFIAKAVDLEGVRNLTARRTFPGLQSDAEAVIRIRRPDERPSLVGERVDGVEGPEGQPVFASFPALRIPQIDDVSDERWRLDITAGAEQWAGTVADAGGSQSLIDLEPLIGGRICCEVNLAVKGPLGTDMREGFVVIPDLKIERPRFLLLPGESGDVRASVASPARFTRTGVTDIDVRVGAGEDEARLEVGAEDEVVEVRVRTARLTWALSSPRDATTYGTSQVSISVDDFDDLSTLALVVDCVKQGIPLTLGIREASTELQVLPVEHSSSQGRWMFNLQRFASTVRQSNAPSLGLVLGVGGRAVEVGRIVSQLRVSDISVDGHVDGDFTRVHVSFRENKPLRNRVARLWSLDRPWEAPIQREIPDDEIGSAHFSGYELIPAGRYRVEIAIDDGWSTPQRPRRKSANTRDSWIGTHQDVVRRLDLLDLEDPQAVVEATICRRTPHISDDAEFSSQLARSALVAAASITDGLRDRTEAEVVQMLVQLALRDSGSCLAALADLAVKGDLDRRSCLELSVFLIPTLLRQGVPSVEQNTLRNLWKECPGVASVVDSKLCHTDSEALARTLEHAGWAPSHDSLEGLELGSPVDQTWAGMERGQLKLIERAVQLSLGQLLSWDAFTAAQLEWLQAVAEDHHVVRNWLYDAPQSNGASVHPLLQECLERLRPPIGTEEWAVFPYRLMQNALHVVIEEDLEAAVPLLRAVEFAPSLLTRTLVLIGLTLTLETV